MSGQLRGLGDGEGRSPARSTARPRRGRPRRLGRRSHDAVREGRVRPAQAGRTGRRPAGAEAVPSPAADPPAVGCRAAGSGRPRGLWSRDDRTAGGNAIRAPPPVRSLRRRPLAAASIRGRVNVPTVEERRARAHIRHRLGRRRPPRSDPARPRRIGRGGCVAMSWRPDRSSSASLRGLRDADPSGLLPRQTARRGAIRPTLALLRTTLVVGEASAHRPDRHQPLDAQQSRCSTRRPRRPA